MHAGFAVIFYLTKCNLFQFNPVTRIECYSNGMVNVKFEPFSGELVT
jgi:hypothetical protein